MAMMGFSHSCKPLWSAKGEVEECRFDKLLLIVVLWFTTQTCRRRNLLLTFSGFLFSFLILPVVVSSSSPSIVTFLSLAPCPWPVCFTSHWLEIPLS